MNLLSIEWLKIKKYRTFWLLSGLFIALLPLWNYGIADGFLKIGGKKGVNILNQAYTFDHVWSNMGWWASLFVIFTTVLTIIIATNEFTFKTQRQNLIDGWTRMQVLHAKWILVFLLAFVTTLYVFIIGMLFGASNDTMSNFPGDINNLFYFFILSLNYYAFGLLIALLVKRSGIAMGLFFLYTMFLEKLVQSLVNWKIDFPIGNLLPLQASDELLPFPLIEMAKTMASDGAEPAITNGTYVLVSVAWIIIYYLITRFRLLKTDW